MKKAQNNKHCQECEDLVSKSNTAFLACEWIEKEGNDILDRLDAIEFLGLVFAQLDLTRINAD